MKLKSYFSGTVEAAMALARKEMGEDALLVNARPSTPETRSLGAFEVVFGVATGSAGNPAGRNAAAGAYGNPGELPLLGARADRETEHDQLKNELAQMKRQIERLAFSIEGGPRQHGNGRPESGSNADAGRSDAERELAARLTDAELDAALSQQIAQQVAQQVTQEAAGQASEQNGDGAPAQQSQGLAAALSALYEVDASVGRAGASRSVIALVGPPGAGKTTTLIKLAARYGLTSRRPAQILSADVFRIAAADQLRSLASILGIGCDVVETPLALAQALEEHRNKDFVFIDTPGLGRSEMDDGADLARMLAAHPEVDIHLTAPASMRPSDLARVIDRYQIFHPAKLLFTRLDETERYGNMISESARRKLPISFLATGQQIPDDLEAATHEMLNGLILGQPLDAARFSRLSGGDTEIKRIGAAA